MVPVPAEFTGRTLMIQCGSQFATAFAYDRNRRQYIVTAKHVVAELSDKVPIALFHGGEWLTLPAKIIGLGEGATDVAVLAVDGLMIKIQGEIFLNDFTMRHGQDVYFLGFPFGLYGDVGDLHAHYPLPFIKKAIIAGVAVEGIDLLYLDGINNRGFSGGPIIGHHDAAGALVFMGVVSGYSAKDADVLYKGKKTDLIVQENTGLILGFHIAAAVRLMDGNPTGTPL